MELKFESIKEVLDFAALLTAGAGKPAQGQTAQAGAAAVIREPIPAAQPQAAPATPAVPTAITAAAPAQAAAPAAPAAPTQAPMQPMQATPAVPTAAPSYTLDDLGRAGMVLQEMGKWEEVQALVASFGVATLSELPVEQYGAFATALRSMGAPI